MRFVVVAMLVWLTLFLSSSSYSQATETERPRWEIGAYTGNLILSRIPQVTENIPPVVFRISNRSSLGILEGSFLNARGNGMKWRSGLLDYRFDFDDLNLPFHALFGFHFDAYEINDGGAVSYGGGWNYGGGAHFDIVPKTVIFRADFINRFGPGRSLLVLIGLSFGLGSSGTSSEN